MGFLDKMKGAGQALTGGGANVSIEYPHDPIVPGQSFNVIVRVISTGKEFKSEGVFVDLVSMEEGRMSDKCDRCHQSTSMKVRRKQHEEKIPVSGAFNLAPNEQREFQATIQLPAGAQPNYHGTVSHSWKIRGRLESFGNDPDSGYQPLNVR